MVAPASLPATSIHTCGGAARVPAKWFPFDFGGGARNFLAPNGTRMNTLRKRELFLSLKYCTIEACFSVPMLALTLGNAPFLGAYASKVLGLGELARVFTPGGLGRLADASWRTLRRQTSAVSAVGEHLAEDGWRALKQPLKAFTKDEDVAQDAGPDGLRRKNGPEKPGE